MRLLIKWEISTGYTAYLAELRVDIILPPTGALAPEWTEGGLLGARCGIFLKTGDLLVCFEKILPWFASLFGQPDRLRKQNKILDLERGI